MPLSLLSLSLILFTAFRIGKISRIFQKMLGAHNTIRILPWTRSTPSFIWKQLCQSLFFNKVAGVACNFIKKRDFGTGVFLWICEISKNTFFTEHLRATASSKGRSYRNQKMYNCFMHKWHVLKLLDLCWWTTK